MNLSSHSPPLTLEPGDQPRDGKLSNMGTRHKEEADFSVVEYFESWRDMVVAQQWILESDRKSVV